MKKDEKTEIYDGPMALYEVVGEIIPTDEEGNALEPLIIGEIVEMPKEVGNKFVKDKKAKLVKAEKKEEKKEETIEIALEDDKMDDDIEISKTNDVKVYNKDNQVVRVYSKEVHGKDFAKLAKQFATKFNYSLKSK